MGERNDVAGLQSQGDRGAGAVCYRGSRGLLLRAVGGSEGFGGTDMISFAFHKSLSSHCAGWLSGCVR